MKNSKNFKLPNKSLKFHFLYFFILSILVILSGCSQKLDPVTGKSQVFEPNAYERASKYARENPVFFGDKGKKIIILNLQPQMFYGDQHLSL